ncbi:hypothetical protein BBBOND_0312930 [Babesia bigemina]|uniref:Uncharacterized protein n=1 Tax=Babesia bigemina TaxID=5866 RepID=A0A061DEJ5_BABBI|nr:hypothetical protein BBBOND_0312930 [Babesia bigemina]CDR97390.1 hypothetical protein BBBOND_0312930 [Babesia bigemina]|eukprot:XP_012769576.1 hypothetical protein BBBOND_0312930 [Babesia bigemina]
MWYLELDFTDAPNFDEQLLRRCLSMLVDRWEWVARPCGFHPIWANLGKYLPMYELIFRVVAYIVSIVISLEVVTPDCTLAEASWAPANMVS